MYPPLNQSSNFIITIPPFPIEKDVTSVSLSFKKRFTFQDIRHGGNHAAHSRLRLFVAILFLGLLNMSNFLRIATMI